MFGTSNVQFLITLETLVSLRIKTWLSPLHRVTATDTGRTVTIRELSRMPASEEQCLPEKMILVVRAARLVSHTTIRLMALWTMNVRVRPTHHCNYRQSFKMRVLYS